MHLYGSDDASLKHVRLPTFLTIITTDDMSYSHFMSLSASLLSLAHHVNVYFMLCML